MRRFCSNSYWWQCVFECLSFVKAYLQDLPMSLFSKSNLFVLRVSQLCFLSYYRQNKKRGEFLTFWNVFFTFFWSGQLKPFSFFSREEIEGGMLHSVRVGQCLVWNKWHNHKNLKTIKKRHGLGHSGSLQPPWSALSTHSFHWGPKSRETGKNFNYDTSASYSNYLMMSAGHDTRVSLQEHCLYLIPGLA